MPVSIPHRRAKRAPDSAPEFLERVLSGYTLATCKHPPLNSLHEAYAVIQEELDEFWDEVKKQREARDPVHLQAELLDISAACLRCYREVVANLPPLCSH